VRPGVSSERRRWRPHAARELRGVWAAMLAVGVVLTTFLVVELARPRDFLTGTNNAGSDGAIVHVDPGQRLCLRRLEVPKGTGRLQLRLRSARATTLVAEVAAAGGPVERRQLAVAQSHGGPQTTPAPLDVPTPEARGGLSGLCVIPSGPIDLAGRRGLEPGQLAPLLDGRPVDARVAVWYLPPLRERKSLLAQMPLMFDRAALFRPGVVGPWTYAVILFALSPALFAWALLLFVRAVVGRPVRRTALAIGAIGFLAAASWSLITPVFNAPDELEHIAYAQAIAERGRAPDDGPSSRRAYSSEAQVAYEGARLSGYYGQRLGRPPWRKGDELRWARRQAVERPPADDGGGWVTVADYTPVYYASLAPAYLAADGQSVWSRVTAIRLMTAVFGGLTAALTMLLVRELLPRPAWPAIAAGLFVAFEPMFAFISGVVNNDAAVSAAAALTVYLVVRALRRGLTTRLAVAIGASLVVLPLMKGNGLFLLPAVAIGLGGATLRTRRRLGTVGRPLAALVGAVVVTAVVAVGFAAALDHSADPTRAGWYAAAGNTYPTLPGAEVKPSDALRQPVRFAEFVWQGFLPPAPGMADLRPGGGTFPNFHGYIERGWADFGFVAIPFSKWVYAVIVLCMIALGGLGVVAWARNRAVVRRRGWELSVLVLVVLGVFFGTEAASFAPGAGAVPEFGRYLFPAAASIAALGAVATFGAGRRSAPAVAGGLVTALLVLFWASEFLAMSALYN
jgi:4-amino-4-deoxy-L-arabinose transferase-like glycosyltransferase